MADAVPLPWVADLFLDARGPDRAMRVSHHPEREVVVLSLWSGPRCRASFRLPFDAIDRLTELLANVPRESSSAPTVAPDVTDEVRYPGLSDVNLPKAV
jgi:hypothetical protein